MTKHKIITSPDMKRSNRVPPGQTVTDRFPVLHYGRVPKIDITNWRFRIFGRVEQERELDFSEFLQLPRVIVNADIHCVTTWSKLNTRWEGVSTAEVMNLVRLLPDTGYVMVHGENKFTTNLTLDDFLGEDVLFAIKYNDEPITPEHGYPLRLVVPQLYFWKSAKWVTGIEFMDKERLGFWEQNGYHKHGDPWKEERYG